MLANKRNKKLVYCFVKKNANSSAKLFFAKHLGIEHKIFFLFQESIKLIKLKKLTPMIMIELVIE